MAALEWDFPDPFTLDITVSSTLIDGYGHVNNVHYVQWLSDCAWAHSAAVGLPEQECVRLRRGMAIREIHVELLAPAYEGDRVVVGNWIETVDGRLRASRRYQILNADSGATLLRGRLDFFCLNLETGRPARMPEIFRQRYVTAACFGDGTAVD